MANSSYICRLKTSGNFPQVDSWESMDSRIGHEDVRLSETSTISTPKYDAQLLISVDHYWLVSNDGRIL